MQANNNITSEHIEQQMITIDPNFNWAFQLKIHNIMRSNIVCKIINEHLVDNPDANLRLSYDLDTVTVDDLSTNTALITTSRSYSEGNSSDIEYILAYIYPQIVSQEYRYRSGSNYGINRLKRMTNRDIASMPSRHIPSNINIIDNLRVMKVNLDKILSEAQLVKSIRDRCMNHESEFVRYLTQMTIEGSCVDISARRNTLYVYVEDISIVEDIKRLAAQELDIEIDFIESDTDDREGVEIVSVPYLSDNEVEYYNSLSSDLLKMINPN